MKRVWILVPGDFEETWSWICKGRCGRLGHCMREEALCWGLVGHYWITHPSRWKTGGGSEIEREEGPQYNKNDLVQKCRTWASFKSLGPAKGIIPFIRMNLFSSSINLFKREIEKKYLIFFCDPTFLYDFIL